MDEMYVILLQYLLFYHKARIYSIIESELSGSA